MIGCKVGSWVLERELGSGGMGSVFQARHASLPTLAAVKVLSPGLESAESFRQRFDREAALQAQLRHPNVARVLDYLESDGHWFLVIEYLDRGSLADESGWSTTVLVGDEASEGALFAQRRPRILHLATHGGQLDEGLAKAIGSRLSKRPMYRGYLLLGGSEQSLAAWRRGAVLPFASDGVLTAEEAGGLDLHGTWLTVLSACHSGAGEA